MTEIDCRFYTPDRSDEGIQAEYSKDLKQQRFRKKNPAKWTWCPDCFEYVDEHGILLTETEDEERKDWEEQAGKSVPEKTCNYCINQNTNQ